MERKQVVAEEHRYNRGKLVNSKIGTVSASSVKNAPNNMPEKFPWEIREEVSKAELNNLIAKKPHH
jgi:hypothetical protein